MPQCFPQRSADLGEHRGRLGGDEPCARRTPGTAGTAAALSRCELLADGIEVVHGYEDEPDNAAFAERARAARLHDDEQRLAREAVDAGHVPAVSVGLDIGVEPLRLAASGHAGHPPLPPIPRAGHGRAREASGRGGANGGTAKRRGLSARRRARSWRG
ncbi:hypothetical protein [Streptomyces sp. NPDC020141]|uniref:hypothetical protein n=1 Tax=Streptomyces sp. NPDC020141 TaxID=3365065 RepID=UPI0037AA9999